MSPLKRIGPGGGSGGGGGGGDGGGSSGGGGTAFIRESGSMARAVWVHHAAADPGWQLITVAAANAVRAVARIASTATDYLDVTLPDEFVRHPGNGNDFDITLRRGESSHTTPAVAAHANIPATNRNAGFSLTHNTPGAAGNNFRLTVVKQHSVTSVTAEYTSATRMTLTTDTNHTAQNVVDAINAARRGGNQLVTAALWNSSHDQAGLGGAVGWLASGQHDLSGGVGAITTDREPLGVTYDGDKAFILTLLPTDTLDDIKALLEALHYNAHEPFASTVAREGSDSSATVNSLIVPSTVGGTFDLSFMNGTPAATPSIDVDSDAKTVTVSWGDTHLMRDLADLDNVSLIAGARPEGVPENAGSTKAFDYWRS